MKFKDKLQKLRKKSELSQEQLADKLNVSRQAVSKWESGAAYPEMDKIIAISKIFNCGIEYLTNENMTETDFLEKGNKSNINIYISNFLDFITKTTNRFFSMKLKSLLKCILELSILAVIIIVLCMIVTTSITSIVESLLFFLPLHIVEIISNMTIAIISLIVGAIGIVVFIHIFKIRYLDYYDEAISNMEKQDNFNEVDNNELEKHNSKPKNVFIDEKDENNFKSGKNNNRFEVNRKKQEYVKYREPKIIIRDPEDKSFKFLYGILKCALVFVKFMIACFSIVFVISLFCLITFLVVLVILLFDKVILIGVLTIVIGLTILNYEFLYITYKFIVSQKQNVKRIFIVLTLSVITVGIGTGIAVMELRNYTYTENVEDIINLEEKEFEYSIGKDFYFELHDRDVTYIVDDNIKSNTIRIKIKNDKRFNSYDLIMFENRLEIYQSETTVNLKKIYKILTTDISNHIIRDYNGLMDIDFYVYGNTDDIANLKKVMDKKYYNSPIIRNDIKNMEIVHYYYNKPEVTNK